MDQKLSPQKEIVFKEINRKFNGNSAKALRARLLQALSKFSVNTFESSRGLSIYDPPARAFELRQKGYDIVTIRQMIEAENGVLHRVGCYVLGSGGRHE